MPNNTTNYIEITGTPEDVNTFVALVSDKQQFFDFNKIIQLPAELVDTVSGWSGELTPEQEKEKEKLDKELIAKYGHKDWYGWQCANWGTKWNAYDFMQNWEILADGFASLIFFTAWSPPTQLLINASKKFPNISFVNLYKDEGGSFVGKMTIENGEIVDDFRPEWFSQDGIRLRDQLGDYCQEDEYEIESRLEYIKNNPDDMTDEEKEKSKKVKKSSKKKSIKKK
jgi:hypothetical protein